MDRERTTKTTDSFRYILQLLRKREYVRWQGHRGTDNADRIEDHIPFVPLGMDYGGKGLTKAVTVKIGRPMFTEREGNAPKFTNQIMESIARLSGLPWEGARM